MAYSQEEISALARLLAQQGMIDPTGGDTGEWNQNEYNNRIMLEEKASPETMFGDLVGQALGNGLRSWGENYRARGAQNDKILAPNTSPEERNKLLEQIKMDNPKRYDRLVRQLGENGINVGSNAQAPTGSPAPNMTGINQNTTRDLALKSALDLLNAQNGNSSLGQAVTNAYDEAVNWERWKNLLGRIGWGRG